MSATALAGSKTLAWIGANQLDFHPTEQITTSRAIVKLKRRIAFPF